MKISKTGGWLDKSLIIFFGLLIFGIITFFLIGVVFILIETYFPDTKQYTEPFLDNTLVLFEQYNNRFVRLLILIIELLFLGIPLYLIFKYTKISSLWRKKTMKEIAEQHDKENSFGKHVHKEIDSWKKLKNKDKK